jgi:hypothetical protein
MLDLEQGFSPRIWVRLVYHRHPGQLPVTESVVLPPNGEPSDMTKTSSEFYRDKAFAAEKLARQVGNKDFRCAWSDIAIEWHALANRAAHEADLHELEAT